MNNSLLSLENVSAGYGGKTIVRNISFTLEKGEILSLLGANGQGKTTLIKTVCSLKKSRSGRISIGGVPLDSMSHSERAGRLAYVPQNHTPGLSLSIRDMTVLGRQYCQGLFSRPGKDDYRRAEKSLDLLGMWEKRDALFTELSGGEQRLVLIARALTQSSDFIILDEPASNLDLGNQIRVMKLLRRLADEGIGILLSSHFPQHCLWLESRTALLEKGSIKAYGKASEVITGETMTQIYGMGISVYQNDRGVSYCEPDFIKEMIT